jgi:P-type Cu+ transporter
MSAHSATDPHANPNSAPATELLVRGMNCNNCARHVTEAIQSVAGVRSATVTLEAGRAAVRWDPGAEQNISALIHAVQKAGYDAEEISADTGECCQHKPGGWQSNLWLGVLCTAPMMIGEWVFGLGTARWFQWLSLALAGVAQIFAGARFYRGAWNQLKIGSSNMDTLVALGSTTAFAYSAWALLTGYGGHLYFMEAAAIITLISAGHWLESRMSERASSALQELLNLAPSRARRRNPDGSEMEIPIAELKIGDAIVLRPGDRVPTDGNVIEGDSAVDEAMLTGESMPVDKKSGSELYAGTLNLNGRLLMRVTAMGETTALAQIIAAVQRAQTSRANIQRLGDRVSSVFVPIVVLIAAATALWWGLAPESAKDVHDRLAPFLWNAHPPATALAAAFIGAAAVLIVACPCAMGLATPVAIMAGANAAAQRGILIRDGVALEKAGTVTAVIFDKTGTLTAGKPAVARIWENSPLPTPDSSLRNYAAALARHSTHPISQAIAMLSSDEMEMSDWKEIRGAGVEAKIQRSPLNPRLSTVSVRLGSMRWLREAGVDLSAGEKFVSEWSAQGATIVGVAIEKSLSGLFAVKDPVKPGARDVVRQLRQGGLKIFMVTGDNALTAASLAKEAGIQSENVFAEIRPEQKAAFVKNLNHQGERVAFVGDGINDAPALEQADLGIAVSRASDIAREAADIILLNSEIEAVPEALGLARATLRAIKQNLFWAFFYNAIGVPLAALGFMSPILCAATMGFSDLVVIGNALRLRKWKMRA